MRHDDAADMGSAQRAGRECAHAPAGSQNCPPDNPLLADRSLVLCLSFLLFTPMDRTSTALAASADRRPAISYRAVGSLVPDPRNARTHPKRQVDQIVASIQTFGFTNPILIDPEGSIIAGHGRLLAAKAMGLADVPRSSCPT